MVLVIKEEGGTNSFKDSLQGKVLLATEISATIPTEQVYTMDGDLKTRPVKPIKVVYNIVVEITDEEVTSEDIFTEFL